MQRVYFGVATPPITFDANFVQNTLGNQGTGLGSGRQRVINYITGPGQKMYYAFPNAYGGYPENFRDSATLIEAGFVVAATIMITTTFATEYFNIWESEQSALGFVGVEIT